MPSKLWTMVCLLQTARWPHLRVLDLANLKLDPMYYRSKAGKKKVVPYINGFPLNPLSNKHF